MAFNKKIVINWMLLLSFSPLFCHAAATGTNIYQHPIYLGLLGGWGSTTWDGLVPSEENTNLAMNLSMPVGVREGGGVWGAFVGYEVNPFFAFEANYMHYPRATVYFDSISLFTFNSGGLVQFETHTELFNLMGKFMVHIPTTKTRVFASAGIVDLHRKDMLTNDWYVTPGFGVGVNYLVTEHVMGEIAGNYTAGYGESQLNPSVAYYPFLYSVVLRIAYRI